MQQKITTASTMMVMTVMTINMVWSTGDWSSTGHGDVVTGMTHSSVGLLVEGGADGGSE